jgi:hypothetical protein
MTQQRAHRAPKRRKTGRDRERRRGELSRYGQCCEIAGARAKKLGQVLFYPITRLLGYFTCNFLLQQVKGQGDPCK